MSNGRDNYELRLDNDLIAELRVIDAEFPWMWFEFVPTPAFAKARSLFLAHERFRRSSGRTRKKIVGHKRADQIWNRLLHKGLCFVNANTGERAEWFFVRLRGTELDARFAFTSWSKNREIERAKLKEEYKHLFKE